MICQLPGRHFQSPLTVGVYCRCDWAFKFRLLIASVAQSVSFTSELSSVDVFHEFTPPLAITFYVFCHLMSLLLCLGEDL